MPSISVPPDELTSSRMPAKTPEQQWRKKEGKNTSVADCTFGTPS